jgi:hypothetical protein
MEAPSIYNLESPPTDDLQNHLGTCFSIDTCANREEQRQQPTPSSKSTKDGIYR